MPLPPTMKVLQGLALPQPLRYSTVTMCTVLLVGLVTAFFAPEARDKELPA